MTVYHKASDFSQELVYMSPRKHQIRAKDINFAPILIHKKQIGHFSNLETNQLSFAKQFPPLFLDLSSQLLDLL